MDAGRHVWLCHGGGTSDSHRYKLRAVGSVRNHSCYGNGDVRNCDSTDRKMGREKIVFVAPTDPLKGAHLLEVLESIKSTFTESVSSADELMMKSAISSTLPSPRLSHIARMPPPWLSSTLMRAALPFLPDLGDPLDFLEPPAPLAKLPAYPVHLFGPSFGLLNAGPQPALGYP